MALIRAAGSCALWAFLAGVLTCGCSTAQRKSHVAGNLVPGARAVVPASDQQKRPVSAPPSLAGESQSVSHAGYEAPQVGDNPPRPSHGAMGSDDSSLSLEELVAAVRERNPTLQAAWAAWAAASERYPQAVALDDPMFQSMFAPGSFPSTSNVQSSYYLGIGQKIPWFGKRALRGDMAQAEANALALDSQEVQLRLEEATRVAYFDYYLVHRELELIRANIGDTQKFRGTAQRKFELALVTYQDVLQAEVELAKLESQLIEFEQNGRVTTARINTLLHRAPAHPLPPPVVTLPIGGELPPVEMLRQLAVEQRPELSALASRLQAEQAAVELACKEFYPDFEFMGRYDQFWTDVEQRPQVGMNMNIPLNQSRRRAAVREATCRLAKMQAEYQQQIDNILHDVQAAYARAEGSRQTVQLYADKILPKAQENVEAATSGYEAGTIDFLRLIEAQRELLGLREKQQAAIAEYHRRRAGLERIVGSPLAAFVSVPDPHSIWQSPIDRWPRDER
ncbi:MAG: TolC family protein [Planctomycetaceae bacterium]